MSKNSDLEPGPLWTVRLIQELIIGLEEKIDALKKLHDEAAELFIGADEFARHEQMREFIRQMAATSLERPAVTTEEIEEYLAAGRGKRKVSKKGGRKKS